MLLLKELNFEWWYFYLSYAVKNGILLHLQNITILNQNSNVLVEKVIDIDAISFAFIYVTLVLTFIAILVDHNHENEDTGLYNILVISAVCLMLCFSTLDLFWFYVGFKSVTLPIYYLIHMYSSDLDKFKACDWYALFSFFSSAVLSFAVAMLASQYRTTNVNILTTKLTNNSGIDMSINTYIYLSLLIAFMIKLPIVPFHM